MIGELALVPGTGGVFEVRADHEVIWSRADKGRFPDIKELKQLVRDWIAPEMDLGHTDRGSLQAPRLRWLTGLIWSRPFSGRYIANPIGFYADAP